MPRSAFSAAAVLAAVWAYLVDVDHGLLRELRRLCTAPGALVARQLARRKEVFRDPLRLFVVVNLVFFVIGPQVGLFRFSLSALEETSPLYAELVAEQQAEFGLTREVYEERFDNNLSFRQPTFALLLVPMLALLAKLFDLRRPFGVHVMFALYAASWCLLSWPLLLIAAKTLFRVFEIGDPWWQGLLSLLLLGLGTLQWFARAQAGGYGRGVGMALVQALMLTASWFFLVAVYGQVLFWLTWALLPRV